jgi:polyribonucleotide nucleotidyltransferase
VKAAGEAQMRAAFAIRDKQERVNAISAARDAVKAALSEEELADENLGSAFKKLEARSCAATSSMARRRIDGRDTKTCVRSSRKPASCRAPTARRCSPAARRRACASRRSAPATTSRSSTR